MPEPFQKRGASGQKQKWSDQAMTDYTELQKAAEYAAQDTIKFADESEEMRALKQFHEEVDPETVLALMAENERLSLELSEMTKFRDNAANHMRRIRAEATSFEKERDRLKAENEALCAKFANLKVSGFSEAFYTVAAALGITGARPLSPMQVLQSEILPALEAAVVDAKRYRFFRENSLRIIHASSQCWVQRLDKAIDDAMTEVTKP